MMKTFSATTEIAASPETVWRILTDARQYPQWDPGMIRLDGTIAPGQQITIFAKVAPDRAFKPTVTVFEPNRRMVWRSGMPLGLFHGTRTFLLEPLGNGRIRFTLTEVYGGLMLPMIGKSIPDLNPVFAAFNAALKRRAESV